MRIVRKLALLAAVAGLGGCVLPCSWDARTNGAQYAPDHGFHDVAGQPGVADMRSGSQNGLCIRFGGDDR